MSFFSCAGNANKKLNLLQADAKMGMLLEFRADASQFSSTRNLVKDDRRICAELTKRLKVANSEVQSCDVLFQSESALPPTTFLKEALACYRPSLGPPQTDPDEEAIKFLACNTDDLLSMDTGGVEEDVQGVQGVQEDAPVTEFDQSDHADPSGPANYTLQEGAYGPAKGLQKLFREMQTAHSKAVSITDKAVKEIVEFVKIRQSTEPVRALNSQEEIAEYWRSRTQQQRNTLLHLYCNRYMLLKSAYSTASLISSRVKLYHRDRSKCELLDLDTDAFDRVLQKLPDIATAAALASTCRFLAKHPELKDRLPQLHIRMLPGSFPHARAESRDFKTLKTGVKVPVMRNFVVSRDPVRITVDFCTREQRDEPLQRDPMTGNLVNPESQANRVPVRRMNPHVQGPMEGSAFARFERAEDTREGRWNDLDGPEEAPDALVRTRRLKYKDFFKSGPPSLSVMLVYAETHIPVFSDSVQGPHSSGIKPSNQMSRYNGTFSAPSDTMRDFKDTSPFFPSQAKFHIPFLSHNYGDALFKLRITGWGETLKGQQQLLRVFSEPFEVVSRLSVIKTATLRLTPEELRVNAAKRSREAYEKQQEQQQQQQQQQQQTQTQA
mgnify:CR=1 FL=1